MIQTNIKPRKDKLKLAVVTAGFFALARAMESMSHFEESVQRDILDWEEGYTFSLNVMPNGPSILLRKENSFLKLVGFNKKEKADLIIEIKNLDTAFKMISTQLGAHHVHAQHKIGVVGNIADSMKVTRIMFLAESYLFPRIISKRILKKSPYLGLRKQMNRLHIYTFGMLLGK